MKEKEPDGKNYNFVRRRGKWEIIVFMPAALVAHAHCSHRDS